LTDNEFTERLELVLACAMVALDRRFVPFGEVFPIDQVSEALGFDFRFKWMRGIWHQAGIATRALTEACDHSLMLLALFATHRILQSADGVLHLACSLVGLALSFQLLVAEDLPSRFFHGSLGLFCRTFDSIFIHCRILVIYSLGV
jgi:hypothetical protein